MFSTDEVITELMVLRKYTTEEMYNCLKELKVIKVANFSDLELLFNVTEYKTWKDWGLVDSNNRFILSNRYVLPIRNIDNQVTALVGWYPDVKKYITTPTYGFSRDAQFFGIDAYSEHLRQLRINPDRRNVAYMVEGIFDTVSLRSLGLFALGNMGLDFSPIKQEILNRFGHIFAIPDADKAGKSVFPFASNDTLRKKWNIPNATYVKLKVEGVKDMDDLIKTYDCLDDLNKIPEQSYIFTLK